VAYLASFVRPIFFVRWMSPKAADVAKVAADFFQAHEAFGKRVVYIAIVPEDCEPPDDNVRLAMTRGRDEVLPYCEGMHIVMEGHGFKNAILRNALATMQLFGRKRDQVHIHRTVEEALFKLSRTQLPEDLKFDPKAVIAKARFAGVLTPQPGATGSST
jgi:hypothetical protein